MRLVRNSGPFSPRGGISIIHTLPLASDAGRNSEDGSGLLQVLIRSGVMGSNEAQFLLRSGIEDFDPTPFIDPKVLYLVPEKLCKNYRILPIDRSENELLLVVEGQLSSEGGMAIKNATGLECRLVVTSQELAPVIDRVYRRLSESARVHTKLGTTLVNRGLITHETLNQCLEEQQQTGEKLGEILVRKQLVTEEDIFSHLSSQMEIGYVVFRAEDIDRELVRLLPRPFAERCCVLPLRLRNNQELEVAMADPNDLMVRDLLSNVAREKQFEILPLLASKDNILRALDYAYSETSEEPSSNEPLQLHSDEGVEAEDDQESDVLAKVNRSDIRKMVDHVLTRAIREGASDIHIENLENDIGVRLRIDGILHDRQTPFTKSNIDHVVSVLKLDANLDITERRRPQDGVFKRRIGSNRHIDFRLSVSRSVIGEDAVIRVLDRSRNLMPLSELGFPNEALPRYLRLIHNPQGLVLATGPTGSGKTTTLYSSLKELDRFKLKVVTAEDPVEYHLDRICQYQVNEAIGNTFAEYGRRFLRQDPDVILIGELRDEKTVDICTRASMTGHLVFSTLHTNDSLGVIRRLRHLGADPDFIAECLLAVVSQRLARRLCTECRRLSHPDKPLLREFFPSDRSELKQFYTAMGCSHCAGTGYKGRIALYELWLITDEMKSIIADDPDEDTLRKKASEDGLKPLIHDGFRKVETGLTDLQELRRVLPVEQINQDRF